MLTNRIIPSPRSPDQVGDQAGQTGSANSCGPVPQAGQSTPIAAPARGLRDLHRSAGRSRSSARADAASPISRGAYSTASVRVPFSRPNPCGRANRLDGQEPRPSLSLNGSTSLEPWALAERRQPSMRVLGSNLRNWSAPSQPAIEAGTLAPSSMSRADNRSANRGDSFHRLARVSSPPRRPALRGASGSTDSKNGATPLTFVQTRRCASPRTQGAIARRSPVRFS
jgi:hypothetical protein